MISPVRFDHFTMVAWTPMGCRLSPPSSADGPCFWSCFPVGREMLVCWGRGWWGEGFHPSFPSPPLSPIAGCRRDLFPRRPCMPLSHRWRPWVFPRSAVTQCACAIWLAYGAAASLAVMGRTTCCRGCPAPPGMPREPHVGRQFCDRYVPPSGHTNGGATHM